MTIYPNTNYETAARLDSAIFAAVENEFNNWIESSNPANEYDEMYFGEDSIYTKKGAIRQAIEELIAEADETQKPVSFKHFDFDAIFQG